MKRTWTILTVLAVVGFGGVAALTTLPGAQAQSNAAQAITDQTVTLGIENMFCVLCPITVKTAMERVAGVKTVSVSFEEKAATVVFDPAVTTPEEIAAASTNIGYPAHTPES